MAKVEGAKYKSLLVARYFMENGDADSPIWMNDILDYLENELGMPADRRSVYRDIDALREELGFEIEEEKIGRDYKYTFLSRPFEFDDLRLLAECVYAAKFISEPQAKSMVKTIADMGTAEQSDQLQEETFNANRSRTTQKGTMNIISTIKAAMATTQGGERHEPSKISFNYLKYTIDDLSEQKLRRKGARYKVSPYRLIINDGYYYLLAFSDKEQEIRTYRIDRMKDVREERTPRDGEKEYAAMDMKSYTQRVFGMFGGESQRVSLRFINPLLDTIVDRFGTKGDIIYRKEDASHFAVNVEVEISDQFFGWLLGFGNGVKIMSPPAVVEQFTAYLDKIRKMY